MSLPGVPFALLQEQADPSAGLAALGVGFWVFVIVIAIVELAAMWKIFEKAGKPGWAAIIPIYNVVVLLQVAGKPVWWIILMLIPIVNIIVAIVVIFALAKNFGKGGLFAIGLLLLGLIFYPILGFGDAEYQPT